MCLFFFCVCTLRDVTRGAFVLAPLNVCEVVHVCGYPFFSCYYPWALKLTFPISLFWNEAHVLGVWPPAVCQRPIQSTHGGLMLGCGGWNKYKRFWDEGMDWNKTKVKQNEMDGARSQTQPKHNAAALLVWFKASGESSIFSLSPSSILTLSCQWTSSMWSRYSYKSTHCLNSFPFLNPDNSPRTLINIHSSAPQISKM